MIFISLSSETLRAIERIAVATETIALNSVKLAETGAQLVAQIDDLKTAIANLGTEVSDDLGALNTSIQNELTAIAAALSTGAPDLSSVIQSVNDLATSTDTGLKAAQAQIDAETAKLSGTPPPTP